METEVKQRNQRNRRRERAQRMQAQRESKVKDGDSGEDESPAREKPPRPPARRKKSKEPLGEEEIIDGFAIMAFRTYEDLEVSEGPGRRCELGQILGNLTSYITTIENSHPFHLLPLLCISLAKKHCLYLQNSFPNKHQILQLKYSIC